jgi:hypothetical protein
MNKDLNTVSARIPEGDLAIGIWFEADFLKYETNGRFTAEEIAAAIELINEEGDSYRFGSIDQPSVEPDSAATKSDANTLITNADYETNPTSLLFSTNDVKKAKKSDSELAISAQPARTAA